jgi:hypothetical protein
VAVLSRPIKARQENISHAKQVIKKWKKEGQDESARIS